jgi:hypothetical protein
MAFAFHPAAGRRRTNGSKKKKNHQGTKTPSWIFSFHNVLVSLAQPNQGGLCGLQLLKRRLYRHGAAYSIR